jgi:hypothetical protein
VASLFENCAQAVVFVKSLQSSAAIKQLASCMKEEVARHDDMARGNSKSMA